MYKLMIMIKDTLSKEDFDLTKKYELFDVIYIIGKDFNDNKIKAWEVIGHVLNFSFEKRAFEYELCSYPISVYISKNEKLILSNFRNHFISKDRNEVVEQKKALLNEQFQTQVNDLK